MTPEQHEALRQAWIPLARALGFRAGPAVCRNWELRHFREGAEYARERYAAELAPEELDALERLLEETR